MGQAGAGVLDGLSVAREPAASGFLGRYTARMEARETPSGSELLSLRHVGATNWRGVARLEVEPAQRAFVAEPSYYLALCCYGATGWRPLAVHLGEPVIGFLMWARDEDDGSCWLGGILIDRAFQGRGYGKNAVRAALGMLAERHGFREFALSYRPDNLVARRLYTGLGFEEAGEMEDDEVVARLRLAA